MACSVNDFSSICFKEIIINGFHFISILNLDTNAILSIATFSIGRGIDLMIALRFE